MLRMREHLRHAFNGRGGVVNYCTSCEVWEPPTVELTDAECFVEGIEPADAECVCGHCREVGTIKRYDEDAGADR